MKQICGVASSCVLVLALVPVARPQAVRAVELESSSSAAASTEAPYVPDEVLVVYEKDITAEQQDEVASTLEDYSATETTVTDEAPGAGGEMVQVSVEDEAAATDLMDELSATEGVAYVQRNYLYYTMEDDESPSDLVGVASTLSASSVNVASTTYDTSTIAATSVNDPLTAAGQQNTILNENYPTDPAGANVAKAWTLSKCAESATDDSPVTVAVFDTGIDVDHPDLVDNIDTAHMGTTVASGGGYTVQMGTCDDIYGHGTHVAGIVAASTNNGIGVAGVSYNATILPINIFSYDAGGTSGQPTSDTARMCAAYSYLEDLIRTGELNNLRVVNMSLGTPARDVNDIMLRNYMQRFRDSYNVLSVCAGGNGTSTGPNTEPNYPGDFPEAFSVTWLDQDGSVFWRADYNQYKDISAPGTSIMSTTDPDHTSDRLSYGTMSGSSMATPVVSGIAALIWAKYPTLTSAQVRAAIQQTAHTIPDAPSSLGSAGAADAAAALLYAEDLSQGGNTSVDTNEVAVADIPAQTYTGQPIRPALTITYGERRLVENTDYYVIYHFNVNVGTAYVEIHGIGDFQGLAVKSFNILPQRVPIPQALTTLTYTGGQQSVTSTGVNTSSPYYYISGTASATNAGTYSPWATLRNSNYCWADGTTTNKTVSWTISPRPLSGARVSIANQAYTGGALTPAPTVYLGEIVLQAGTQYAYSAGNYSNNVGSSARAATASLTVYGIGNYTGSATGSFTITPQASPMYRLYNPNSGEHFYTASAAERDNVVRAGWRYEGVGWNAPTVGDAVYRLYNPNAGDHHYTTSAAERDNLIRVGWRYEGVGWYSSDTTGAPLYRQYNPNASAGAHNFTTSLAENNHLVSVGWRAEGIAWYGVR